MKVALVYDRVNKWGGAERVLLTLHEMFPAAPLYTSVYNPQTSSWANVFSKVIPSFLNRIPLAKKNHELLAPLMPAAFESFNFDEYDLVISVTSEAAKGIITKPGTKHICYCLTPIRYLWSGYRDYFKKSWLRQLVTPLVEYLQNWDQLAAQRPDKMIAISTEVQKRIKKYYGRESEIIFPPVASLPRRKVGHSFLLGVNPPYYLVVSRLVKYKKVDLAIRAFNDLKRNLIIVGTGKEEDYLKSIANSNIKFVGQLDDADLADYYQNAKALIFPQKEDFGLVAVEAQSFGVPVIAFAAAGALDTVEDGVTGIFFNRQTKKSLLDVVSKFEKTKFDKKVIVNSTQRFSKERFKKEFLRIINDNKG